MKIEDRLSEAMHEYGDAIEPSTDSWLKIAARFDDTPRPRRPARGRRIFAGVATMLVIVLIAVLAVRDDGPSTKVATGPDGVGSAMPSRILAIAEGGAPILVDSTTGRRLFAYDVTVAEGSQIAVTPNGNVAYVVAGNGNEGCADHSIVQMQVGSGSATTVLAMEATEPTVSPDGRHLAYLHCLPGDNRADEIVLRDLTTGDARVTPAPPGTFFINRLEFAADSQHVVFNLYEDALGHDTFRELDVVNGEAAPGRDVGVAGEGLGWAGLRGTTGEFVGVAGGSQPSVVSLREPSPFAGTRLFDVPDLANQVISDASGKNILARVGNDLYRWSEGDDQPTKIGGSYLGAAWIPDVGRSEPPDESQSTVSIPTGVLAARTGGEVVSMDATSGAVHETLVTLPDRSSLSAVPPDGLEAVYGTVSKTGPCAQPRVEVGTVELASGMLTRIVSGATSPIVSPDGRFVAYGIQCDGITLGFSDLRDGMNYRIDPFPSNVKVPRLRGIDPIAWAPDSERILYRAVFEGSEDPTYWIGRLWPLRDDTGGTRLPEAARFSTAAFVDNQTLAIAADHGGRSTVGFVDLKLEPGAGKGFVVPGRIERLTVDPSGRHFLAVTLDGELFRWSVGDAQPTKLAEGVIAATWTPWS